MIYLDTSAFVKLYIRESGSESVQRIIEAQDDPLPVWELLEAEFMNALRLKMFWKELDAESVNRLLHLFVRRRRKGFYFLPEIDRAALMADFRTLSAETPRLGCRTLDILHVACALQVEPTLFLTFDQRQRDLARHAGLDVGP